MKKYLPFLMFLFFLPGFSGTIKAQSCDILYFCVSYDSGEVDCSDRFTTGKITVVTRLAKEIYFTKVWVQIDKFNPRDGKFAFYKDYEFNVDPDLTYIYFSDIEFTEKGFYRVFLLDPNKNTITSALVEII